MIYIVCEECSNGYDDWEEICGVYDNKESMIKDFPDIDKDRLDYPYTYNKFELNKKGGCIKKNEQ